jgi:hypothetical protein
MWIQNDTFVNYAWNKGCAYEVFHYEYFLGCYSEDKAIQIGELTVRLPRMCFTKIWLKKIKISQSHVLEVKDFVFRMRFKLGLDTIKNYL